MRDQFGTLVYDVMQEICRQACKKWDLCKAAAVHRLGTVHVQEASIVIATSSAHRQAATEACHWIIDEVKAAVPVWKKECFADGSVWKENKESRMHSQVRL
jgi:molybdopterin synthase catalytic subunit